MEPSSVRTDGQLFFLLWQSGDAFDHVLAQDGRTISFPTRNALEQYAAASGLQLEQGGDQPPLDLEAPLAWLHGGPMPDLDVLLNVWNLAGDVARGTGRTWSDRSEQQDHVYDLLFAGNNLPAMTPPGEHFTPDWNDDELAVLRRVIGEAIDVIRGSLGLPND